MPVGTNAGLNAAEEQLLRDVGAAIGASDFARAAQISEFGLQKGIEHPVLFNARALWAQQQDRHQDALDDFNRALVLSPRNFPLLNAIGLCLVRLNRATEAVASFDAAIKIAPAVPHTHYRKGWAYESLGDQKEAKLCYERAVALKPDYAEALSGLAVIAARNGDPKRAREYAERSLRYDPTEPTAIVALAMADIAEKAYSSAESRLKQALAGNRATGHTRAVMLGFLADALDGQDRVSDAFDAYVDENEEYRRLHEPRFIAHKRAVDQVNELADYFEGARAQDWASPERKPEATEDGPRQHVFLLGFLRSGTTLLEQVLVSHPDVVSLEERETFANIAQRYLTDKAGLDSLANLSGDELDLAREIYWSRVREYGIEPRGKVFIDKQPLNTFNLPLIAKLFPDARVIFAQRDPRDVVFSCFRRHFEVNATTYELLRLDDGARYYAAVMRMAELCREKLPLSMHTHIYESMVQDFDSTVQAICAFLDIEWSEEMRNFSETARAQSIRSPSASQVRRRLYDEGVAQWRRYGERLQPIFPILHPWVVKFGYQPN